MRRRYFGYACRDKIQGKERTIQYEQSLWERWFEKWTPPFDHIVSFLKKDMIKAVYLNPDGTEVTVWEATEEERERYLLQESGTLG